MKILLPLLTILLITGCADKDQMAMYYKSIEAVSIAHQQADTAEDIAYIKAISALKNNPMAILALALTKDRDEEVIDYSGIYHPQGFVEGVKAVTPIVTTGIAWGLGAWGVSEIVKGMGGATYNASGDADMAINSTLNDAQNEGLDLSNSEVEAAIAVKPAGTELQKCLSNPPGGVSDNGIPLFSPGLSCTTYFP